MQPLHPQPSVEDLPEPLASDWRRKLGVVLFMMVCFEVGLFLLVFPWLQYWRNNSLAGWLLGCTNCGSVPIFEALSAASALSTFTFLSRRWFVFGGRLLVD